MPHYYKFPKVQHLIWRTRNGKITDGRNWQNPSSIQCIEMVHTANPVPFLFNGRNDLSVKCAVIKVALLVQNIEEYKKNRTPRIAVDISLRLDSTFVATSKEGLSLISSLQKRSDVTVYCDGTCLKVYSCYLLRKGPVYVYKSMVGSVILSSLRM